jgi:hypothetical protein
MTITSKYASVCQSCGCTIIAGDQVNWVKGVKGVTCAACPAPNVQPAPGAVAPALQAAFADARALRARIGELEASLAAGREHFRTLRGERDALAASLALTKNVLSDVQRERNELLHAFTAILGTSTAAPTVTVDDGDLIDVMAPGGVEAWLAHDLAQIAAEKAAKASAPADDTNDCPI